MGTLATAAQAAKIPYLQEAAKLALNIVNVAQNVRSHKESFQRLANDSCQLVYVILLTVDKRESLSAELLDNLRELLRKLSEIERFSRKEADRGVVIRAIKHKSDLDTISEFREGLRQSLDVFGLKSSISIQDNLSKMAEHLKEMERRDAERERAERTLGECSKTANESKLEGDKNREELVELERKKAKEKARLEKFAKEQLELEREMAQLRLSITEKEKEEEKKQLELRKLEEERKEKDMIAKQREQLMEMKEELRRLKEQRELEEQERVRLERREALRREEEALRLRLIKEQEEQRRAEARRQKEEHRRLQEEMQREQLEKLRRERGQEFREQLPRESARTSAGHRQQIPFPFSIPGNASPYPSAPSAPIGIDMSNIFGTNNHVGGSIYNYNSGNHWTNFTTNSHNNPSIGVSLGPVNVVTSSNA